MYSILTWTRKPTRAQVRNLRSWLDRNHASVSVEEVKARQHHPVVTSAGSMGQRNLQTSAS